MISTNLALTIAFGAGSLMTFGIVNRTGWWPAVPVTAGIICALLVTPVKADCSGCSPNNGPLRHLFDEKGNPKIIAKEPETLAIDPRGVIWYKGKRADDLTNEELLEVAEILLEMLKEPEEQR